jgi:hypothetical protein
MRLITKSYKPELETQLHARKLVGRSFGSVLSGCSMRFTTRPFGRSGSVVVKALCYKPEGRGFETG